MKNSVDTLLNYELGKDKELCPGSAGYYLRTYDKGEITDAYEGKDLIVQQVPVTVRDARGYENFFSLDGNGFEFAAHESKVDDWEDEEQIQTVAYPEIVKMLQQK